MAWVKDEIGHALGLPAALGGIPLDEVGATGWGLRCAAEIAGKFCGLKLDGARIAVQGFGAVGKHAARFLAELGAVLVAASDSRGTIVDPAGIDVHSLIDLKAQGRAVADYPKGKPLAADAVIDVECDIWIPAARPDVLSEENAHRLRAKLMLEGANIPCTKGAEKSLHERGVLIVPDFVANAGGVVCAAMEYRGATQEAAFQAIAEKVGANTEALLSRVAAEKIVPREAAEQMAVQRVRDAMRLRRFSIM
jgi:glutamate dehydrogenase (NAD(P)+)